MSRLSFPASGQHRHGQFGLAPKKGKQALAVRRKMSGAVKASFLESLGRNS